MAITLPYQNTLVALVPGKEVTCRVRLKQTEVQMLANEKVTGIKLETSTIAIEDAIEPGKQMTIASICQQLLRR